MKIYEGVLDIVHLYNDGCYIIPLAIIYPHALGLFYIIGIYAHLRIVIFKRRVTVVVIIRSLDIIEVVKIIRAVYIIRCLINFRNVAPFNLAFGGIVVICFP